MRFLCYFLLVVGFYSCSPVKFTSFPTNSIKGYPIAYISILEFEFSDLDTIPYCGVIPSKRAGSAKYFLESEYYEEAKEHYYQELYGKYENNLKILEDSLTRIYPKAKQFKEINLLTDTIIKFREYTYKSTDNFSTSNKSYTLGDIIKPNRFYKIDWGRGKKDTDFNEGPHGGASSSYWLVIMVDNKREITYWKETKMDLYTRRKTKSLR